MDLRNQELSQTTEHIEHLTSVDNGVVAKQKILHFNVSADDLNHDLVYPYRAIIEASIKQENVDWPILKNIMSAYFATRMRSYANRNPKYSKYINGLNEMAVIASEGKAVNTIINTAIFDFKHLWKGIDLITKGRTFKNVQHWKEIELYPIVNFDFDLKKHFLYDLLEERYPGIVKDITKNKYMLYVTSDFNFAVNQAVMDIPKISDYLLKNKCGNAVDLSDGVKLYLVDFV